MTSPALCLSAKRSAEYVGVSLSSFYKLIDEKAIACERPPHGHIRCSLAALDAFKRSFQVDAVPRIRTGRKRGSAKSKPSLAGLAGRIFELARVEAEGGSRR